MSCLQFTGKFIANTYNYAKKFNELPRFFNEWPVRRDV